MGARIHFKPQLKEWILHNIDRGIPPSPLVQNMVEQGFDAQIADQLVRTIWSARAMGTPIPDEAIDPEQIEAAQYRYAASGQCRANTIVIDERSIRLVAALAQPVALVFDNVLSADECAQLIALASQRLAPSTLVDPGTGMDVANANRSSEGMFFQPQENPLVARIERRVAQLMNLPLENGEGLQILRYRSGAQITPHFDFLMPTNAANRASLERSGQRVSTMLLYLNDVVQGGETLFPEIGFQVAPRQGSALYFEYCNSAGQLDARSLHASAPVGTGEKWVATKWMRQRRFVPAA